ncbi:MAG: nuclear transport factor 2 family protein [Gammaproteobacteria bacterium]|nr:nuclear transport factor 2 family protein [Gammaproteobacteria bacterium]
MATVIKHNPQLAEIEDLLYAEASCLDNADLDSWIQLYTDDGTYWMPLTPAQPDPLNYNSLIYDDRTLMEVRRRNLVHPRAPSKQDSIRGSHIIANIRIVEIDHDCGDCTVTSNFHAMLYYKNKQMFAGRYLHRLKRIDGKYLIHHKRVDLIDCDAPHRSIIIYL